MNVLYRKKCLYLQLKQVHSHSIVIETVKMTRKGKRGDVWISAVLYILIGLAIMGLLLMVVRPRIEQMRDSITIDQTLATMNRLDETISRTICFTDH